MSCSPGQGSGKRRGVLLTANLVTANQPLIFLQLPCQSNLDGQTRRRKACPAAARCIASKPSRGPVGLVPLQLELALKQRSAVPDAYLVSKIRIDSIMIISARGEGLGGGGGGIALHWHVMRGPLVMRHPYSSRLIMILDGSFGMMQRCVVHHPSPFSFPFVSVHCRFRFGSKPNNHVSHHEQIPHKKGDMSSGSDQVGSS